MKQSHIDRRVARATGESRRTIARYGFSLLDEEPPLDHGDLAIAVECGGCGQIVPLPPRQYQADDREAECVRCDAIYPVTAGELFAIDALYHEPARRCA